MSKNGDYSPYKDRLCHRYVNKMSAIIARNRLIIKSAIQAIDDLEQVTNEFIEENMTRVRKTDES